MAQQEHDRGARSLLFRETVAHPAKFSRVEALRLRRHPLLLLALCFAGGILCKGWWQPSSHRVLLCGLLWSAAGFACLRAPRLALPATAVFWIALGWTAAGLQQAQADTSLLRYADELQRTVNARVVAVRRLPPRTSTVAQPVPRADEEDVFAAREPTRDAAYSLELEVQAIEEVTPDIARMVPVTGGAQVTLFGKSGQSAQAPPCGATVRLTVRLHPPHRYLDPGVWQYAELLNARGISVQSNADAATLRVLDAGRRAPLRCRFAAVQRAAVDRLHALAQSHAMRQMPSAIRLDLGDVAMLSAMLFGDRTELTADRRMAFERTGSFHLFVVAGLHVAVLLAVLYQCLLWTGLAPPLAAATALLLTLSYALLTGFGAPVQRALLMSAAYLLATLLGRKRNPLNALGGAVLAMLLWQPGALFDSGFQLTVLAVFAVAAIAAPLAERTVAPYARALRRSHLLRNDPRYAPRLAQLRVSLRWLGESLWPAPARRRQTQGRLQRIVTALPAAGMRGCLLLVQLLLITVCAGAVMALPMAVYFHRATPLAAPANVLLLPLIGPLMGCAGVTFALSLLHPAFAVVPGAATALLLHAVTHVVESLGNLRAADVRVPGPALPCIVGALLTFGAALALLRDRRRSVGWVASGLLPLGLLLTLWPAAPRLHRDALEFTAIDVGQGDSLMVASPQAQVMLIDAGGPTGAADLSTQNGFDIGEQVISPTLWSRGIRCIDVLVLTHAHSDHIGGMLSVLRNFRPRELWVSVDAETQPFRALIREAEARGVRVRHLRGGDRFAWSGTVVSVLNPPPAYRAAGAPTNDDSLVLHLAYGRASVLAEGDAEHAWEDTLAQASPEPVTLLKVGHHGSNTSTSALLLRAFPPEAAVISCGLGNHFGHPRMPVLQRLQAAGVRTARTDNMGAVQYLLHPDGSIETHVLASDP